MAKIEPSIASPVDVAETSVPGAASNGTSQLVVPETGPAAGAPATEPREVDQLARIEDKAARIEEKFARYESVLARAESSLERSAQKVDAAAGTMDFSGIREEVAALRRRVEATPRFGALVTTAVITALLTVVLMVLVLKFGVPGLFGGLLPR